MAEPTPVTVGTLNVRNKADQWRRRRGLLLQQMGELEPDLIGLQELRRFPGQARGIAGWVNSHHPAEDAYQLHTTYKTGIRRLWEGIAIMTRLEVLERDMLELMGQHRVANLVRVRLPDGAVLDAYNTHLSSVDEAMRTAQAGRILEWMERRPGPQVLVGDFNARPPSPTVTLIKEKLRSAYAIVHGDEPPRTIPTPLRAQPASTGVTIDYVFVNDLVRVHDAWVTFDRVDPDDAHLAASDHYGVAATVSVPWQAPEAGRRSAAMV